MILSENIERPIEMGVTGFPRWRKAGIVQELEREKGDITDFGKLGN
jgi:hypothetical protein